jgi:predicted MFS family arabinose efflux permease
MGVTMTFLALGTSFTNPSTMGAISLLSGSKQQGTSMGVAQSLASLGRILGPALGGLIYEKIAIDAPFIVSSCLAVAGLVLAFSIYNQIPNSGKTQLATEAP